ncbi:MAG: hypothetical protein H6Q78_625, partial [Candidatus Krumholzibacteriota bacterium]|nr:hypothetical protein [Candidatus Krumholzibacteriota bacterium]
MRVSLPHRFAPLRERAFVLAGAFAWIAFGARSVLAAEEGEAHELPNFITVLYHYLVGTSFGEFIH